MMIELLNEAMAWWKSGVLNRYMARVDHQSLHLNERSRHCSTLTLMYRMTNMAIHYNRSRSMSWNPGKVTGTLTTYVHAQRLVGILISDQDTIAVSKNHQSHSIKAYLVLGWTGCVRPWGMAQVLRGSA